MRTAARLWQQGPLDPACAGTGNTACDGLVSGLRFSKMHGAGNDFVVLDAIDQPLQLNPAQIRLLADRHRGVGFDQLLVLRRSVELRAPYAYEIYNTDGSTARQCGNGARCVAAWLGQERALTFPSLLSSPSGVVGVQMLAGGEIGIELGRPRGPVAAALQLQIDGVSLDFESVDMGNPHLVLAVDDVQAAPVTRIGAALNSDAMLAGGVNVEFVQRIGDNALKARVYERGAGETLACGSGACAAAVVAIRHGWVQDRNRVLVHMPGGTLAVSWPDDEAPVLLSGPTCRVFDGTLHPDFFRAAEVLTP